MRLILLTCLTGILVSACIGVPVNAYRYATSGDRRAKQHFIEKFNRADFDRQKNGMEPLDFCTEQYYFDKDWARNNPNCASRVVDYESGNTRALGTSILSKQ